MIDESVNVSKNSVRVIQGSVDVYYESVTSSKGLSCHQQVISEYMTFL